MNVKKVGEILDYMEESLNVTKTIEVLDVNTNVLEKAGEMFLYLFNCPEDLWSFGEPWTKFIRNMLKTKPLRIILLHLNNFIMKYKYREENNRDLKIGKEMAVKLLKYLRKKVNFQTSHFDRYYFSILYSFL